MGFKVVVIDDKPLIREAIVKTIDWNSLGCEVVGQASDGLEGKRVILENKPDIIITDIKMPGLDGLDLTELIKPLLPMSKTIVITGYQDFEYAKKAVKLGVFDFILKPIKNEELYGVIEAAANEIKKGMEEKEQKTKLEQKYNNSIPFIRSKKVNDLINRFALESEVELQELERLGLDTVRHSTIVIRKASQPEFQQGDFLNSLKTILEEISAIHDIETIETSIGKDLIVVIMYCKVVSAREARLKVKSLCSEIQNRVVRVSGTKCTMAVSSLHKSLFDLPSSYNEAVELLNANFFRGDEKVLFADSMEKNRFLGEFSIFNDLEEFYKAFEDSDNSEIQKQLDALTGKIGAYSNGNIFIAKSLLSEVCITAARYYYRTTGKEGELGKSIDEILQHVDNSENIMQAIEYMKSYVCSLKDGIGTKTACYSPVVKNVLEYISSNFSSDISLESVGEHFSVNPSYLSRLLKKETGENFIDVLTTTRIDTAKKLLKDPQNRVNEVAEMVGYKDYAYFYQVFKRVEGISPTEYKKNFNSKKI